MHRVTALVLIPFPLFAAGDLPASEGDSSSSLAVADWLHFHPHLNAAVALGGSTSEKNLGLIAGSHAPQDDGFNLQGIEFGAVIGLGDRLSLRANHNVFWDRFDGWDSEWEEGFAEVEITRQVTLRGGQFFAPFGYENTLHLHDRDFVEPPISMIRLLGEEGLVVQGGELAWSLPRTDGRWMLRFGYGQGRDHNHGDKREARREAYEEALEHGAEEQQDHEDGDQEHDHEEHEHHGHGFAGNGGVFDAETAYLDNGFFFGRVETKTGWSMAGNAGISFAAGKNGWDRTTWMMGADVAGAGEWSERPTWWRGEAFFRHVSAEDFDGRPGEYDEVGIYAASGIEFMEDWTLGGRLEWASGNRMSGNERRWRAAANVGHIFQVTREAALTTRLQYSYDRLGGYADEHSVWLQFIFNFGSGGHGHGHSH